MDDFRIEPYRRCVSAFKSEQLRRGDAPLRRLWRWFGAKYLPLIEPVDRQAAVLELGCGSGYMREYLQTRGFTRIEGVDISDEQVALARQCGLSARTADVWELLDNPAPTYGLIIAPDFLEHFAKDELLRYPHDQSEQATGDLDGKYDMRRPQGSFINLPVGLTGAVV